MTPLEVIELIEVIEVIYFHSYHWPRQLGLKFEREEDEIKMERVVVESSRCLLALLEELTL